MYSVKALTTLYTCRHTHIPQVILPDSVIPNSESTLFPCCCSAVRALDASKDKHSAPQDVYHTCIPPTTPHLTSPITHSTPCPLLIPSHSLSSVLLPFSCPLTILCLNSSLSPPTACSIFPVACSTTLLCLLTAHYSHRK